jgi:hypothetical protein
MLGTGIGCAGSDRGRYGLGELDYLPAPRMPPGSRMTPDEDVARGQGLVSTMLKPEMTIPRSPSLGVPYRWRVSVRCTAMVSGVAMQLSPSSLWGARAARVVNFRGLGGRTGESPSWRWPADLRVGLHLLHQHAITHKVFIADEVLEDVLSGPLSESYDLVRLA